MKIEKRDRDYFIDNRCITTNISYFIDRDYLNFEQVTFFLKNERCEIIFENSEEVSRKVNLSENDLKYFELYKSDDFAEIKKGTYVQIEKALIYFTDKYVNGYKSDVFYEKNLIKNLKKDESYFIFFRRNGVSNSIEFDGGSYSNFKKEIEYIVKVIKLDDDLFELVNISLEEYKE